MTDTTSGTSTTDKVKDKAVEAKDKAQEVAGSVADKARSAVDSQVDSRTTQAGDQLATVSEQARGVSNQLRESGNDTMARFVEQAAGQTDRLSQYLRDADYSRIVDDLENVARRQPWLVALGGLAVGFAASRILKASREARLEKDAEEYSPRHAGGYSYTDVSDYRGGYADTTAGTGYASGYSAGSGYTDTTGYATTGSGYGTTAGEDAPASSWTAPASDVVPGDPLSTTTTSSGDLEQPRGY